MEIVVALSLVVSLALSFLNHFFVTIERGQEITDFFIGHAFSCLPGCQPLHDFTNSVQLKKFCGTNGHHLHTSVRAPDQQSTRFKAAQRFTQRASGKVKAGTRSEEHTSELQSRPHLVCR